MSEEVEVHERFDLEEGGDSSAEVPYERGIPLESVVRGTLARFLPASFVTAALGILLISPTSLSVSLLFSAATALSLTAGFGVGLLALRRWLFPDAEVDGRRSLTSGALAPLLVFVAQTLGVPIGGIVGTISALAISGVVIAVLMFFAWLSPTPEQMRAKGALSLPGEADESRALPGADV